MIRPHPVTLLAIVVLAGLCSAPSCREEEGPPQAHAERVVMVSYDGLGADLAWQWIGAGVAAEPDGLAALAGQGFAVRRLRMASPTLTAVNHATLATGRPPSATGVVSNVFHRPGTPVTKMVMGNTASYEVPALWTAASRQGVRVGTLMWPAADAGAVDRMGDFGVVWPRVPLAASEVLDLEEGQAGTTGELISRTASRPCGGCSSCRSAGQAGVSHAEVATYDGTPTACRASTRSRRGSARRLMAARRRARVASARARGAVGPRRTAAALWLWASRSFSTARAAGSRLYRGALWRRPATTTSRTASPIVVGPSPGCGPAAARRLVAGHEHRRRPRHLCRAGRAP
jgi:hypothetical protein